MYACLRALEKTEKCKMAEENEEGKYAYENAAILCPFCMHRYGKFFSAFRVCAGDFSEGIK